MGSRYRRRTVALIVVLVVGVAGCARTESSTTTTSVTLSEATGAGSSTTSAAVKAAGPCDLLGEPTVARLLGAPAAPKGEPGAQAPSDWCTWTSGPIAVKVQRDSAFLWETMSKDPASAPYDGLPVAAIVHAKHGVAGTYVVALVGTRTVTVDVSGVDPDPAALKAAAIEAVSRQQGQ